ncbi:UNKNOWN [Stylonychia lemnae]|uniref:Uncharacterized protein n=1 Tax=Stylonychia lemnae TaxID=5949 RepID=A0A077ZN96_STYLE|nr:UNKNOWN [Stylonychia lemnae]|eukprot:CDW71393.1 UNKNOWN [Stylonychia lemnae]
MRVVITDKGQEMRKTLYLEEIQRKKDVNNVQNNFKLPSFMSQTQRNFGGFQTNTSMKNYNMQSARLQMNESGIMYNDLIKEMPKIDSIVEIKVKKPKVKMSKILQQRIIDQLQQRQDSGMFIKEELDNELKSLTQRAAGATQQMKMAIEDSINHSRSNGSISNINDSKQSQGQSPRNGVVGGNNNNQAGNSLFSNHTQSQNYLTKYSEKFIQKALKQNQRPQKRFIQGQYPLKQRSVSLLELQNTLNKSNNRDLIDKVQTITVEREKRLQERYIDIVNGREHLRSMILRKSEEKRTKVENDQLQKIQTIKEQEKDNMENLISKKFLNSQERYKRKIEWLKNETDRKYSKFWDQEKQQKLRELRERSQNNQYKYINFCF